MSSTSSRKNIVGGWTMLRLMDLCENHRSLTTALAEGRSLASLSLGDFQDLLRRVWVASVHKKHFSCTPGHSTVDCLRVLLDAGADPNERDDEGSTPLMYMYDPESIMLLLRYGAIIDAKDSNGKTALHHAMGRRGYLSPTIPSEFQHPWHGLQALVNEGADLEARDDLGRTPLMDAAVHLVDTNVLEPLIRRGANVTAKDNEGLTALHHVARYGWLKQHVSALVKAGAKLESTDNIHCTPLMRAVHFQKLSMSRALVESGASVNATGKDGCTPILLAYQNYTIAIGSMLIQAGAIVSEEAMSGDFLSKCLLEAARENYDVAIRQCVKLGVSVDFGDDDGNTPLCLAAKYGHNLSVSALLAVGANVDAQNAIGDTALMIAVQKKRSDMISMLACAGANLELHNKIGDTALIISAKSECEKATDELITANANIEARNNRSESALSVALSRKCRTVAHLLANHGARIDSTSMQLFPLLRGAVQTGDLVELAMLVKMGCSVNDCRSSSGWTALHYASYYLQLETVKWLFENGADVSTSSADGSTALHFATQAPSAGGRRQVEIIRVLLANGADPTVEDGKGQTPLSIAEKRRIPSIIALHKAAEFQYLIKAGGEPTKPDTVALRFGGPPGAGKSTLSDALRVTRSQSLFRYEGGADTSAADMQRRTKGINCQLFMDENQAKFSILDLGGHGEFLATHQTFIGDGSVPVIDCVVVSALDDNMESSIFKWCSLFASRNQPAECPWPLLLIATRADKASDMQKHAVVTAYHEVKQLFGEHFRLPFDRPFFVDARKSWSSLTVSLRQALGQLHGEVLDQDPSPRQPAICQSIVDHLPALRKKVKIPVVTKSVFIDFMRAHVGFRAEALSDLSTVQAWSTLLDKALRFLSGFATVLSFSQPLAENYVVIEPHWLLTNIVGRLMSEPPLPDPYVRYDNGYAKKNDVLKVLDTKHLPGEAAFEMVAALGFCLEQHAASEVLNPSKLCGYRRNEHWRRDPSMTVNGGRRLKCKGVVAIANAFFPHLQVHFYHRYLSDYDKQLTMWSGGIRVVAEKRSSAEALIETNPAHSYIDIIVRGEAGSERDCAKLLFDLTEETLQKAAELSPGSQLQLFYLSRMELDELSPEGLPSKPCVEYAEESVLHAVKHHQRITDKNASRKPEEPHSLLLWLPPEPLEPLNREVSEQDWRIILLELAKTINTFDECTNLASGLSVNERGDDIVLQLRSQDPHRLPPEIGMKVFELWLRRGASQLTTDERREVLHRLFLTHVFRADLCDVLEQELGAGESEDKAGPVAAMPS